ncbi:MAG: hypothetical protein IJY42_06005 [Clostridia bacterium]|nr:hypothetical protein [Clostridia bacterium]
MLYQEPRQTEREFRSHEIGFSPSPDLKRLNTLIHCVERQTREDAPIARHLFVQGERQLKLYLSPDAALSAPFSADGCLHTLDTLQTEESCFEQVCDWAEAARNRPILLMLSAREEEETLLNLLRGIYRGAVYTPLSLLWHQVETPYQAERLVALGHRAFCELSEEAREFNGYPKKGILLDTPLTAFSDALPRGLDILCFHIPRLFALLGGKERGKRSEELQRELEQRLALRLSEEQRETYLWEPELSADRKPEWAGENGWSGLVWSNPLSERTCRRLGQWLGPKQVGEQG